MDVLGIDIDESSRDAIRARVDGFLRDDRSHRIATVNPEFLVEADRNPLFREVLCSADLRVADGFGVVLAGFFQGKHIDRYPGADLLGYLLAKAEREGLGVFLAIRNDGLSLYEEIRNELLKKYPRLICSGEDIDFRGIGNWKPAHPTGGLEIGNSAIVFCNAGAPQQEFFLEKLRKEKISSQLLMGVGGAFDFLTGKRKRAPRWMRMIGLEWLWRLLHEPRRASRIWNATAVFLWKIFFGKKKDPC